MALLDVKNLTKNFGGLTAVGDVTMHLDKGELVGLIGPNGAGKTTLFNLLTGVYEPSEGSVSLDGTLLNGKKPYKIASLGLSRTFQNIRLFKDMTVLENVLVGMANQNKLYLLASFLRLPKFYHSEAKLRKKQWNFLLFLTLMGMQKLWLKTFLMDNNVVWKSFVPLRQNLKFFSWMNPQQG